MKAIRVKTEVGKDKRIILDLPSDTNQGEVEIIVLMPDQPTSPATPGLNTVLQNLSEGPRYTKTKQEIDYYLDLERRTWE